ncbi:hypothetical protein RJ639_019501 [Escallonia herrerae]|uniref:Uncharacterized protein n=1 Tax=Escallonia herrerae TaxID=1293975 RepID=A0AA88VA83_9ASTE|nr:hypothetical protein RJ639_019501 [Escallonia herrerae]
MLEGRMGARLDELASAMLGRRMGAVLGGHGRMGAVLDGRMGAVLDGHRGAVLRGRRGTMLVMLGAKGQPMTPFYGPSLANIFFLRGCRRGRSTLARVRRLQILISSSSITAARAAPTSSLQLEEMPKWRADEAHVLLKEKHLTWLNITEGGKVKIKLKIGETVPHELSWLWATCLLPGGRKLESASCIYIVDCALTTAAAETHPLITTPNEKKHEEQVKA